MAEPDSRAARGAATLPTPNELFLFLEGLRQQGYRLDARHITAAERLLLDAVAAREESEAAPRLKFRLAPIIAKTPEEQEDFYRQFDRWCGSLIPTAAIASRPTAAGPATEAVKRDPRRLIIAGAVALGLGLGALATWYFWPPPPMAPADHPQPPPSASPGKARDLPSERFTITEEIVSPFYQGVKAILLATPLLLFSALLVVRWRRRAVWLSHGTVRLHGELATVAVPVRLSETLFSGRAFRDSAQGLRKHRSHPTRQLDVRKTVHRTAARAGLFSPVYRERPQSPEYVFLIEQNGANDHLARLFDVAVERLRSEDVFIQRYYFHTDPWQVQADDAERTQVALPDLLARTHDHRLFIIATADGFFHPLTGEVEGWVQRLQPWQWRMMLSIRPLDQWTLAELKLLEEGFSLATAEASGFAAAGEKVALGTEEPELLEGVIVMPVPVRRPFATPPPQVRAIPDFAVFRDVDAPWCPEMVALPAGDFLMGSPLDEAGRYDDEGPQHRITIGRQFAIGRYPVTFAEYDHFCAATGRKQPPDKGWGRHRRPVINVSWQDARAYAEWLTRETGQPYRLPSEAEWEHACRAGTTSRFSFGDTITPKEANYSESQLGKTTEAGSYAANSWGLHDMHGTVWEWVEDSWHETYQDAPTDGSAWTEGGGGGGYTYHDRVIRGGSWNYDSRDLRSANRGRLGPGYRSDDRGFRVARTLSGLDSLLR